MQFFLFFAVVIMILFGTLHFQNDELTVTMKFITWTFEAKPISLVLAVSFAIGIITGGIIFVPPWLKKASLARHQKKQIHEFEAELAELKGDMPSEETEKEVEGEVIIEGARKEV